MDFPVLPASHLFHPELLLGLQSLARGLACMTLQVPMYLEDGSPAPAMPVAGQDFMPLTKGDVVDVIVQNLAANANGVLSEKRLP